jgi:hypothetical protein
LKTFGSPILFAGKASAFFLERDKNKLKIHLDFLNIIIVKMWSD